MMGKGCLTNYQAFKKYSHVSKSLKDQYARRAVNPPPFIGIPRRGFMA